MADYDWFYDRDWCKTQNCSATTRTPSDQHAPDCKYYKQWKFQTDARESGYTKMTVSYVYDSIGSKRDVEFWECTACYSLVNNWKLHSNVCSNRTVIPDCKEDDVYSGVSVWDPSNPPWDKFSDDELVEVLVNLSEDIETHKKQIEETKQLLSDGMHKMLDRDPSIWAKWRAANA